jgi:hypothetical protein
MTTSMSRLQRQQTSSYSGGFPFEVSRVSKTSQADGHRPASQQFASSPEIQPAPLFYRDQSSDGSERLFSPA